MHPCAGSRGIHDLYRGAVDGIYSRPAKQVLVMGGVSRIAREVLAGPELDRVHKDAHHDDVVFAARRGDQAAMPGMERPHRWHEPDLEALSAPPPRRGEHRGGSCVYGERTIRRRTCPLLFLRTAPASSRWPSSRARAQGTRHWLPLWRTAERRSRSPRQGWRNA